MFDFISPREVEALINSLGISITVTLIACLIGYLLAIWVWLFKNYRLKKFFDATIILSFIIPAFFHALAWQTLFEILIRWQIIPIHTLNLLRSPAGVVFVLTAALIGLPYILISRYLNQLPTIPIIAGLQIAPPIKVLRHIVIRSTYGVFVGSMTLTLLFAFASYDVAGFYEVNTFPTEIFRLISIDNNIIHALQLSIMPAFISFIALWLVIKFVWGVRPLFSGGSKPYALPITLPHKLIWFNGLIFIPVLIICSLIPLGAIIYGSRFWHLNFSQDISANLDVITNTVILGSLVGLLSFIPSLVGLLYNRFPLLRVFILASYAIPAVMFGLIAIYFSQALGLRFLASTPIVLIGAYLIRFLPITSEIVYAQSSSIAKNIFAAGRIYQPNRLAFLSKIALPLFIPSFTSAALVTIWLTAVELPITLLLQPPGLQTLSSRLFILLHYGSSELMNALTIILIFWCLAPLILLTRLLQSNHAK